MGTGASKDTAATLMPTHKSKKNSDSNRASKLHPPKKGNTGTTDTVRIGLTKLGFSPAEVTVSEGQSISINWNAALGSNGHNVRQVVFDGQAVHSVQGGYNSGPLTQDGNFDIQFNLQGEFSFKSDGYEANSSKVLHVTVKSRHYVLAELTEERFVPSVLHVEQGNCVKWVWNSTHQAHSMQEVRLCPKHYGILQTNGGTSVPMQSGSYKHEFQNPGLFYFQTEGHEDGEMQLCVVHVKATQRHHCVEVTDRRFQPRLLTITQGDRVWWLWDRFKCKKKHRIQQMEVPTGPSVSDPFPRPVKGGFSSDAPSRAGMLSHIFQEPGVFYYCDNNYDDNREYLGVVIVKPRAKEHNVEVTAEGFYPDLTVADGGDRIWWNWEVDNVQDNFSVMQVDSCVASDNKTVAEVDCNNLCTHLTPKAATMITRIGLATVQLNTPGVYHYRVSDTPITVGCCSVIVNPGQKDHCISVKDTGFEPKVLRVHPGDRVWWAWENTKQQHNIFQVSRHGHPTKEGFCSGQPQDSPAAFVRQFNAGAVVYYQSVALPKLYGAVVAVSQPQIHQVLVSKNHLQPDPVLAQTHDCVAWVWPVLRKHGLTQLTNTQQVFELQTYTQDVVTPRRCCALRFSNPGVYHYYSKAFSNKTDKFMYEHSSKTVLSSVVVSNPSGPVTVLVSSKGFKPAAISINRGQGVLWSWKGSHSETHNIVHVNPPSHERPYSPVAGPLAFSSGNPEPNNSFLFTFEEPGTFFETSEGAPGCVGVVHVLDDESLSAMPIITSSSNGGVVERLHNVELQSASQTATILYTLDGSIPELHGQATRVYKSEKGISLRQPGLHIIRALAIDNGALPSKVFTSKRFWVLEGNVGHGSEDDDAVSMATDDLEAEMQNSGPGPTNKWQWWNCVPSISGWLHSGSDNSLEIYWDLPSIPYRGQLKSYQLYVNGICYHNDLPPTCHSITVDGLTGNQTYIISILAQPRDSTLLQQESNRLKVTCPSIYELGGPILSCEVTDQEDTINLVWTSLDYLYTEPTKYLIYVDGRETPGEIKTIGDCKKCQLTLPQREVHQAPLTLFIVTLPGEKQNESDGFLSNELQLPLPLCLDNIHLPNGGSLAGKPFLIIKEGRGKPPDAKADLLPSIERRESFDGSVSTLTRGNTPHEDIKDAAPNRSMECEETFNCTGTEVQTNAQPDTQADSDPPHQPESDSVSNACIGPSMEVNPCGTQHPPQNSGTDHGKPDTSERGAWDKNSAANDAAGIVTTSRVPVSTDENHTHTDTYTSKDQDNLETQSLPQQAKHQVPIPEAPEIVENSDQVSDIQFPTHGENEQVSMKSKARIQDEAVLDDETGAVFEPSVENGGSAPLPNADTVSDMADHIGSDSELHSVEPQSLKKTLPAQPQNDYQSDRDNDDDDDMHATRAAETGQSMLHANNVSCCGPSHDVLQVHENGAVGSTTRDKARARLHDQEEAPVLQASVCAHQPAAEQAAPESEHQERGKKPDFKDQTWSTSDNLHDGSGSVALHGDGTSDVDKEPLHDECVDACSLGEGDPSKEPVKAQHERVSLPKPVVSVHSRPTNTDLHVRWQTASCHPTPYVLHHYSVCVAGRQFDGSITSHSRQEMSTDSGEAEVQHCWNAGRGQVFVVTGLSQNTAYSVTVNATYHHKDSAHQSHVKRSSHPIVCTTGGPPLPPRLWAKAVGLQEVTLSWLPGHCHEDIDVMGYQLTRNGKVTSEIIPYGKTEKTIKNLKPDFKHCFSLSMVTTNAGQTKASNFVTVTCPEVPDAPAIRQEPSTEEKSAVIVWHQQKSKQLTHYQVYVDGRLHGEVQPKTNKKHAYLKYTLLNLKANGRQYKVAVRAHAGWSSLKGDQPTEVTCGVLSPESNLLTVACSRALPVSLDLRLECIHSDSVDIMWAVLDEDEASEVQGFIILKDDHPHSGSILPPSITHATLSNLKPGSALTVQVLAISQSLSNDSGEEPITDDEIEEALKRCPPNLILQSHVLQVDYDGLVPAPSRIWCELVTSHSFMVVWDKGKKQRRHCAAPESYTVTWWELSKKSGEPPQSKVTSDDHLLIDGLDLGTKYCITVQARGKRTQPHRGSRPDSASYEVPVLSQTESITVTTASPPEPPSQLTVASVGSNTVQLKWEPPTEKGAEVIGLRVYVTMQSNNSVQTVQHADLLPDATSAIIKNLQESSTYSLHLVTITDEFFDKDNSPSESPRTKLRGLPEDWSLVPKDSIWLPCVSVDTTTTGVSPPSDLSCTFDCSDTVTLNWRASAHEQRTLKKYEVQWAEVKSTGALTSSSDPHQVIEIPNGEGTTSCEIPGLNKGVRYCFTVVAVITELDSGKQNLKGSKKKGRKQSLQAKENLIRLASEPYVIRIPAPCIAPYVLVTGFGLSWVDVYWEKPPLVTVLTNQENDSCSGCIHRTLLGYLLSINGTTYARLKPTTQQYTINCSPGKTYEIGLTAITTTDKNVSKKLSIGGRGHSWLDSAELEGLCDRATSEPLTVTLPKQQSGNVVKLSAEFHPSSERQNDDSDENNDLRGDIHLEWVLQDCGTAEEQGIVGYDITWLNDADVEERVATLPHTATNYDIPVYHSKCVYTMSIHATQYDDMWQGVPTPSIQCVIPGPPDPPRLCCTSVLQEEFILEWGEPRMYGGVGIRGYQVYMNDKKVGQELSSSHYKAAIPCRPNRTYHMSIVALSADPSYRDSDLSEEVRITCWSPETRPTQPPAAAGTVQRDRYSGQGDGRGKGLLCPEDISIGVLDLTETSIVLEWRLPLIGLESQELVDRIKVMWSSVAKPKELEVVLKPTATQYTVRGCMPGTNHFVAVAAMDKADRVLHRSRLVTIQTTAPLSAPHLRIRSCTYSGCILEWDKPTQFGNAHLAGYQLRLNGKDHDRLPAGASTYLFTAGKMCKEYRFTMQALCTIPHLHSQASEPALVTWPGILPPALHRAATTKLNAIRVSWPEPKVTGGAKVEHYKVMCMEESGTGHKALPPKQRQPLKTLGPLPLDQRWAEFPHLSPHAAYTFLLDTQVSGVGKAVRSRPLNKQYVARRPAPPKVRVTVRGLEERRALEMEACQLVNMRHRLLQELISYQQGSNPGQPPGAVENEDFSAEISDALSALAEMEDQLFQVLETLIPYTGTVAVDVEWDPVRESKDVNLSGFKVLVNDKQSGHLLHSHMDRICLQLSAYDGLHKISMVAATDHPVGNSEPSDVTVIDTSPFLPFTCYCLHSVHRNDSRHPQEGCCSYQQTLALEASPGSPSSTLAALHQQLDPASRRIPPASVTVLDVSDQAPHLLVPTKLTNRCPTMLLFWTHWCLASQKVMDYFVDYARSRVGKVICLTCCCSSTESSSSAHLETLAQLIIRRGWKDDALIRHSCSCGTGDIGLMPGSRASSASTDRGHVGEALSGNEKGTLGVSSSSVVSVAELFGILATPMLVILHPEGYLAWQGCFAACNKNAFATMMDETLDTVVKPSRVSSPRSNSPKLLSRSTSVSSCTVSSLPPHQATPLRRADSNPTASLSRNASISTNSSSAFLPSQLNGSAPRAKSARRRRTTPRQKMISVDQRPFSATKENGSVTASGRPKSSITI
ncbi:uncharacterized protein LOC110989168 isoform X2 [Acanthaster planci]|uniref:Uncharacterized protein LOC110989168 isoform X2 n=1 Tax=Acanthaster planci TaxID=133434 RepID=A0A8B7ZTX8_ACAPL|nr:uncharacterized protein LOC110989168 isoform X2 [Acanthaster planci]